MFDFMFDPDNRLGRILGIIGSLVILNLTFLLFSLPLFTIGASLTALYHAVMKLEWKKASDHVLSDFLSSFRQNFKQATAVWLMVLAFCAVLFLSIACSQTMGLVSVETALLLLAGFVFVFLQYLFSGMAVFDGDLKEQAVRAGAFIFTSPIRALGILACELVPVSLTFLDEVNQPAYVFWWFFIGFSFVTFIGSKIFLKLYAPYFHGGTNDARAE